MRSRHHDRLQRPIDHPIPKSNNLDYELPVGCLCRIREEGAPTPSCFFTKRAEPLKTIRRPLCYFPRASWLIPNAMKGLKPRKATETVRSVPTLWTTMIWRSPFSA